MQKRLLVRYKDKNPSPLEAIELLFERCYQDILDISKDISDNEAVLTHCQTQIRNCMTCLLALFRIYFKLDDPTYHSLSSLFYAIFGENSVHGWEECVDVVISQLLRTVLAKNTKETTVALPPLELSDDPQKFKKHMLVFLDRIKKAGGRLPQTQEVPAETTTQ